MNKYRVGFSLMELMIILLLISILLCLAVPSYKVYLERKDLIEAKQQALKIASELERFKARNYSYQGFDLAALYPSFDGANNQLLLPIGGPIEEAKYVITLVDLDSQQQLNRSKAIEAIASSDRPLISGLNWVMKIERAKNSSNQIKQPQNYDLLINSKGLRCMTKMVNIVAGFHNCGTEQSEYW